MARLVIGDAFFLGHTHHAILFLQAQHYSINGFFDIEHLDLIALETRRKETASMTMLARSAPAIPGVRAATFRRSALGPSVILREWILRMASRPSMSGRSTTICRSNRPARKSAWSRTSGIFVAAMMMTFSGPRRADQKNAFWNPST